MKQDKQVVSSMHWVEDELRQLATAQRRRRLACRESPPVAGQVQIDGHPYLNFSSNDYLGIASDSRLVDAVKQVVGQVGWGAGASPLVTGRGVWHRRLEMELAKFKSTEATLLFPTGFAANVGALTAMTGPGDVIFSDSKNHASIIDGCRWSKAATCVYRHGDVEHLDSCLKENSEARRKLIVTDSVFSMDGDLAPLPELVELSDQHQAMLMVDEAHATGILGPRGSGLCEHFGVEQEVTIRIGTLSKAFGSFGGFVAGSQQLIDLIANLARTYMFSTAQPEAISAASLEALNIINDEPERRDRLRNISRELRDNLLQQGWNCGNSNSQIIPLVVGSETRALSLSQQLRERGLLVPAIRPPAVPRDGCILRISLSSAHSDEQLKTLLAELDQCQQ